MDKECVLVTGAGGEIGHGIVNWFAGHPGTDVIALDLRRHDSLAARAASFHAGDIGDQAFLQDVGLKHLPSTIFHLAGVLSSEGERNPQLAHRVNVEGSLNVLEMARTVHSRTGRQVKIVFPSTIAVYGAVGSAHKHVKLREESCLDPVTMYGANKLYVEKLGIYYSTHYRSLDESSSGPPVDFRCIRFPGILSADTVPTGGTSDYGPEMLHAAARGIAYTCFVRREARLPFMTMHDAVRALLMLAEAPKGSLQQRVYNVTSFSVSAAEIESLIREYFPVLDVSYVPNRMRDAIVESWPGDLDDSAARRDWKWEPEHDLTKAFRDFLIPEVKRRYQCKIQNKTDRELEE